MGTSKFGGKYGSIWGQILGTLSRLRAEIPLWETVRGCPHPVLSKDLNNIHNQNQNTQLNKKRSVMGKTHNGQKKCPYGFPSMYVCIYTYTYTTYIPYICYVSILKLNLSNVAQ